jgi:hypothetical protein
VGALLGVPQLLDAMRAHYGGVPSSPDALRPPACGGGLLPLELRALRQGLLDVALTLLHAPLGAPGSHRPHRIAPEGVQARARMSSSLCLRVSGY